MNNWKKGIKTPSDFTSKDIYKFYKQTHPKPLNYSKFSFIIKEFNKQIIDKVYEGLVWKVPANLGFMGISVSKTNVIFNDENEIDLCKSNLSTDWGATNKLWRAKPELAHKKFIFHENLHSDGRRFKIKWERRSICIPALYNYRFKPSRSFARNLTQFIKNNPNIEYYEF